MQGLPFSHWEAEPEQPFLSLPGYDPGLIIFDPFRVSYFLIARQSRSNLILYFLFLIFLCISFPHPAQLFTGPDDQRYSNEKDKTDNNIF